MRKLLAIRSCVFSLLASVIGTAEEPQANPAANRERPVVMTQPAQLLPDQAETPRMKAWCDLHYGLFLHFNMNTYGEGQHPGALPASAYQPVKLDVDSWVRIARDAGMKYAVLTAKHDSGFCLWDSKVPWHGKEFDYDVAATQFKTDVVRAFIDACKKYGIVPGLYYGLQDFYAGNGRKPSPLPEDYYELVKAHLTELTTRYPECHYYWIDNPGTSSNEQLAAMYELLRRADPRNVVQFNAHLAHPWTKRAGGETAGEGVAPGPATNVFEKSHGFGFPTDVIGSENRKPNGPVPKLQTWQGRQYFVGYEHCAMLGGSWFKSEKFPTSTKGVFDLYQEIRNYGGNLLLDIGPDRQGRIDDKYAKFLIELKARIEPFEAALAKHHDKAPFDPSKGLKDYAGETIVGSKSDASGREDSVIAGESSVKRYITTLMTANDNKRKMAGWNVFNEMFVYNADGGEYKSDGAERGNCVWMRMGFEADRFGLQGAAKINENHPVVFRKALQYAAMASGKLEIRESRVEEINRKSDALYQLIKHLLNSGVRVDAVGFQSHLNVNQSYDWDSIKRNIRRFKDLGLEVDLTELDVSMGMGWKIGDPFPEAYEKLQAERFYGLVKAAREAGVNRIDFWGLSDAVNQHWLVGQRARLFDGQFQPRPTYQAVLKALYDTQK